MISNNELLESIQISTRKATWLKPIFRVLRQLFVSIISYITLPIAQYSDDALLNYFTSIYKGKDDPLLFDGKDMEYLDQIEMVMDIKKLANKSIIDLGCGNGALFYWLHKKKVFPNFYIGIDFAFPSKNIFNNARIIQTNIFNYNNLFQFTSKSFFFVNTFCYLEEDKIKYICENIRNKNQLIIIEPYPSIFWDAHFEGVKLYYRNIKKTIELLRTFDFLIKSVSVDYAIYLKKYGKGIFPMSYCVNAYK